MVKAPYLASSAALLGFLSIGCLWLTACNSTTDDNTAPIPISDQPDELNAAQRATLPDDCLFALDMTNVAYCFSPQDRNLMAVPVDGSTYWRYPLPGNNDDNHVEAVVITGDTLVLVADTGPRTGQSSFEMSLFELGGAFIETLPILEPFKRLRGDFAANPPAWDLHEKDLLVVADNKALYIGSAVHTLIEGGARTTLTDWQLVGSSITRIDADSGMRTAWRVLPDFNIERLLLSDGDRITVSAGITQAQYQRANLSEDALDPATPPLDPLRVPVTLPYMFKQLQAERIGEFRDDVQALLAIAVPEFVELNEPECVYENPEVPSRCSGESSQGPTSWECPLSGSVTVNQQATVNFISGTGRSTSDAQQYNFDSCELDVATHGSLTDGRYQLTGTFETSLANQAIRQGQRELRRFAFIGAELLYPDGIISTTGEQRNTSTGTSFGLSEEDVELSTFTSSRAADEVEIRNLIFHQAFEYHSEPKQRISLFGSLNLRSPITSNQSISLRVDPPLANLYWTTDPVTLSGIIRLETESGDGLMITAFENPEFADEEQLLFRYDGDQEHGFTEPFECLMISCF